MSEEVRALEPKSLWNNFADLNAIPRASKKEEQVIEFAKSFGEKLGLPTLVDSVGNVIIKKPATAGMEGRATIVLQSHLDMVHQKNADTDFDFDTQGIQMYVEGDWVKARGTTLGADNGIGVATIMSLLAAEDISHPPLEALFTIDEETGMTGAKGLEGGQLSARIMLNLDTEDDDELTIGCAGGVDVTAEGTYNEESLPEGFVSFKIKLSGLSGGHSGMDIQLGRGNANRLMNQFLLDLSNNMTVRIHRIDGGGLRNAIPRESKSVIAIQVKDIYYLHSSIESFNELLKTDYSSTDPEVQLIPEPTDEGIKVMSLAFQQQLLSAIANCPNGVFKMSPDIDGLVQTSNNVARVLVAHGRYQVLCLARSSVDSDKEELVDVISTAFNELGGEITTDGDYPGWTPKPEAGIVKIMQRLYKDMYGEEAHVSAVHAGLECGILGTHYPNMEMISFGPNIRGAHSPDEKVQISSVQKFWNYLLEVLKNTP